MPNKLGEDWSRNRTLDTGVKKTVTRPFSITDSKMAYTITSGDNKGEVVDSLPTTKLQYHCYFLLTATDGDTVGWGADLFSWLSFTDYGTYTIPIKLHTYIGSSYNRTTKKWDTLYEHHVWDFKLALVYDGLELIITGMVGKPTCKVYKTYTSTTSDSYTEPYKEHGVDNLVNVGGAIGIGTVDLDINIGDGELTSVYTEWFYLENNFPVDTGMYVKVLVGGEDTSASYSINTFGTLLELDTPKIFSFYDEITGNSHLMYKLGSSYNYDELRLPINTTVDNLSNAIYDNSVFKRTQYTDKEKFMSLLVTNKLEKYILWQDKDKNIKIKHSNANIIYEDVIVVEGSTNPVGYYDSSAETAYIFYCKDNRIYVVSTYDFVSYSEPVIFIDNTDGNIGKQSVGVVEDNNGSLYVLYYDFQKLPQSKLFSIDEIQAGQTP
jgi:hypothetical protein